MQLKRTRSSRTDRRHLWTLVAVLLGVAIIVAACGTGEVAGSGAEVDATATTEPAADGIVGTPAQNDAPTDSLAFANCMRANGVPDFPDPSPEGGMFVTGDIASNPNFGPARESCAHLRPQGQTAGGPGQADPEVVLAFAQCMRENGVPSFPDPGTGGGMALGGDLGIDPNSPQFQYAVEVCMEETGLQINIRGQ